MKKSLEDIRNPAMEVICGHGISVHDMPGVRDHILSGNSSAARSLVKLDYGLSDEETDTLMSYIEPGMNGRHTTLVEITPAEIHFPKPAACRDGEAPLDLESMYFGRRGNVFGTVTTTTSFNRNTPVNAVYLNNERIEPENLDQVWELVQEERVDESDHLLSAETNAERLPESVKQSSDDQRGDERRRRLDGILAARRALTLKYPLEVYEKLRVEPEEALSYVRMTIRYSGDFKTSEEEHISLRWQPIPKGFVNDDGSVHPDYREVCGYPPPPEGMYASGQMPSSCGSGGRSFWTPGATSSHADPAVV